MAKAVIKIYKFLNLKTDKAYAVPAESEAEALSILAKSTRTDTSLIKNIERMKGASKKNSAKVKAQSLKAEIRR